MKLRTGIQVSSLKGEETLKEKEELKFREEMEARRILFERGDKYVLFEALVLCAWFQAVIPDWVAEALIEGEKQVEAGSLASVGELFGKPANSVAARKKKERHHTLETKAFHALAKWRIQGGSFNADECFDGIAKELDCGRRDIEAIYKKHKNTLSQLERKGPNAGYSGGFGIIGVDLIFPRRQGRPPF